MRISYYNLDKDDNGKKRSHFNKQKLLTITFYNHILEDIQFENSDRGHLLWVNTPKTIRVFGLWNKSYGGSRKFYQHWENRHERCGY